MILSSFRGEETRSGSKAPGPSGAREREPVADTIGDPRA
jgi:hypothetical protein